MGKIYNQTVFLMYLGGIFSLFLTVAIIFLKQIQKRSYERKRLERLKLTNPEEVGDIEAKLSDTFEYKLPNFLQEATIWGIQPLFIISFVNLFTINGITEVTFAFGLLILTLFHEFYLAEEYSTKWQYQLVIFGIWFISFFVICFRTNTLEEKNKITEIEYNVPKDSANSATSRKLP